MSSNTTDRTLILLFLASALFYGLLLPRYAVGYYNDDAFYVLGAKSLLQGRYAMLQRPSQPPLNDPLPGYPLLLAPLVKLVEPHWYFLKIQSLALTLLSIAGVWMLSATWFTKRERLWLVALFAFNPTTANFSGSVMSEPAFLAMSLGVLLGLRRLMTDSSPWDPWWVGGLLGWAVLVRPQGVVLIAAVLLGLVYARRWRVIAPVIGVSLALWGGVLLRNYAVTQSATGYLHHWSLTLPILSGDYGFLLRNVYHVIRTLVVEDLFALVFPPHWEFGGSLLATLLGVAVMGAGFFAIEKRTPTNRSGLAATIFIFVFLYFLVHSMWLAVNPRYFLPLLPFILAAFIAGAVGLENRFPFLRRFRMAALVGVVLCYGYQDLFALNEAWFPPAKNQLPTATLRWIEQEIPPSADLLAFRAPVIYLETHRSSLSFLGARTVDEFRYRLLKEGITHILYEPLHILFVHTGTSSDPGHVWEQSRGWVDLWPAAFQPVYQNPQESTRVYRVIPAPQYIEAYELSQSALEDFNKTAWSDGMRKLDKALGLFPDFPAALNMYGTAYLLSGRGLSQAESKFKAALRLRPEYPVALLNLGRVYRQMGRIEEARQVFARCQKMLDASSDSAYLQPALEQAQQDLPR